MHYEGILIGALAFAVIGLFHPIVIKAEFYFGKRIWPVFALVGALFALLSVLCASVLLSALLAVISASSFWSIKELFEQEKRVERGWFPKNPNRKK